MIKLEKSQEGIKAKEVYTAKYFSNHHGGVVEVDGYLYGHTDKDWVCEKFIQTPDKEGDEPKTEEQQEARKGLRHVCGRLSLHLRRDQGRCSARESRPEGLIELGRFTIPREEPVPPGVQQWGIWTHPVIANGKLYLREYEWLFCYDVAAKE